MADPTATVTRHRNKTYVRIPGGEVQYGHLSGSICVWWRGRRFLVRRGSNGRSGSDV